MTLTFSQADLINKARNDFLHWCASEDFPRAHVGVAWAFIDAITKDPDLRACMAVVSECVDRAKEQLREATGIQPLGAELTTSALEGNFQTLTVVVFENKATLIAALEETSAMPTGLETPYTSISEVNNDNDEQQSLPAKCTTNEKAARRVSSRQAITMDDRAKHLDAKHINCISSILRHLMTGKCKKYAEPFWDPVDPVADNAPDYLDIIKHPMDLDTITQKFNAKRYRCANDVKADIELMLANCFTYNPEESEVCGLARQFEAEFRKTWKRYFVESVPCTIGNFIFDD